MKLRLITTAALVATSSAQALTPTQISAHRQWGTLREIYIAGAPEPSLYIAAWFKDQCNPSTYDVFFDSIGTGPWGPWGSNYRAYSCNLRRTVGTYPTGTPVLLVKRDAGGSAEGVNPIAKPNATQTSQQTMWVDDGFYDGCTATGNPSPAVYFDTPSFYCNQTTFRIFDAGVSDTEPAILQRPANNTKLEPLTTLELNNLDVFELHQMIYGVAVNLKAYRALQATQGLVQNDDPANQPSLPRTWVAGALRGDVLGDGGVATPLRRGWGAVISRTVDAAVETKTVNVCRHSIGSGTQARSNAYFLNAGCVAAAANVNVTPGGQVVEGLRSTTVLPLQVATTTGTNAFIFNYSIGYIERCLGSTVQGLPGDAYAIGILSRDNTPRPTWPPVPPIDKGYRFVKLDGIAPLRDLAKTGEYDFVYSATMQWNKTVLTDAGKLAFVRALRANAGRATYLNAAYVDMQEGALAPPSTYTGAWASIVDPVTAKFAARANRGVNQSCAAYRVVK